MPSSFDPISAGISLGGGLLSSIIGGFQRGQANRWLKNNPQPIESMPSEITENQGLARIRANTGLPSEQYNNAMKNIQRQQLMALRRATDLGGGRALSILGGINQQGNDAVGALDAQNATARLNNEKTLMGINNNVANWKHKLFDLNTRQNWLRNYDRYMRQLGAGDQNITNGVDSILAGGLEYAYGNKRNNNISYYGLPNGIGGGGNG